MGNLTIRYVRFTSPQHHRVILIVPGRIESYIKYPELAYDLFHCGYDVVIIDHRGQGRSDRLLADSHRGHVVEFSDYVDDLETLYLKDRQPSLSAALRAGALDGRRNCGAVSGASAAGLPRGGVLCADVWYRAAAAVVSGAPHSRLGGKAARAARYALGTGRWRASPFGINRLTQS